MIQTDIGHGRGWLAAEAAASIRRLDAAAGSPWQVTEAGRTYARQAELYGRYLAGTGNLALPPGTSIHEFGNAIDTDQQDVALLAEHGWIRTVYRNGVLVEPWHFEYATHRDTHLNEGTPDTMATDDSKTWTGERLGGSTSGPSITDLLREINSKLDALALDQTFTKEQLGGSSKRTQSLRSDVDDLHKKLDALLASA